MGCLDFFLLPKQKNTYFYYVDSEKSLHHLKYTHILDYGPMEESLTADGKIRNILVLARNSPEWLKIAIFVMLSTATQLSRCNVELFYI